MKIKNFNDILALMVLFLIPVLWLVQPITNVELPSEVNGGLLVTWSLIIQYYFRKSPDIK